jgi:hypothetical protein
MKTVWVINILVSLLATLVSAVHFRFADNVSELFRYMDFWGGFVVLSVAFFSLLVGMTIYIVMRRLLLPCGFNIQWGDWPSYGITIIVSVVSCVCLVRWLSLILTET